MLNGINFSASFFFFFFFLFHIQKSAYYIAYIRLRVHVYAIEEWKICKMCFKGLCYMQLIYVIMTNELFYFHFVVLI